MKNVSKYVTNHVRDRDFAGHYNKIFKLLSSFCIQRVKPCTSFVIFSWPSDCFGG